MALIMIISGFVGFKVRDKFLGGIDDRSETESPPKRLRERCIQRRMRSLFLVSFVSITCPPTREISWSCPFHTLGYEDF